MANSVGDGEILATVVYNYLLDTQRDVAAKFKKKCDMVCAIF